MTSPPLHAEPSSDDAGSGDATGHGLSERELFELVYRRMRVLAGAGAPDLEDLIQLAAEQVFRSLGSFSGRSGLRTWVYAVCYRVLLRERRWYRRWSLRFTLDSNESSAASEEPSPAVLVEARQRAQRLHQALAQMTDKYRAVVVLHDLEGLTVSEVVEVVAANERTVRSRLRDGRKQLARLLQADPAFAGLGAAHEVPQS